MQQAKSETDWALFCDIDGTLVGATESSQAFRTLFQAEQQRARSAGARIYWIVATGRSLESAREVLLDQGFALEDFDAFVTSVGAELYLDPNAEPLADYALWLARDTFDRAQVGSALAAIPGLKPQAAEEQFPHKVSYFFEDTPAHRQLLDAALATLPFSCQTVWSHDSYLDIAPAHGAKAGGVLFLLKHFGLNLDCAVTAGDSGNDLSMLSLDSAGIVVGNGHTQLASLSSRPNVYFARAKYAAGILEGLRQLGRLGHGNTGQAGGDGD